MAQHRYRSPFEFAHYHHRSNTIRPKPYRPVSKIAKFFGIINNINKKNFNYYISIGVMNEHRQCWKQLLNGGRRRWWIFISAQIHNHPGDVSKESDRNLRVDEFQQRINNSQLYAIITEMGSIALKNKKLNNTFSVIFHLTYQ